jgi:hypothetical protein
MPCCIALCGAAQASSVFAGLNPVFTQSRYQGSIKARVVMRQTRALPTPVV